MPKKFNKRTGDLGEDIACKYLIKNGYKVLQRNFRTRFGEIDIIADKDNMIHIIEVRCRIGRAFGTPEDSLTLKKLRKLKNITLYYLNRYKDLKLFEVEFISIIFDEGYKKAQSGIIKKYNITEKVMS